MTTKPDVLANELTKHYGDLVAVDNVSFAVEKGEIFGLLGPNGAGKTTTLEMLEGLRTPDSGTAEVLGADMASQGKRIKQRVGVQLQATALPQFTKVREALQLFGSFYDHARSTNELLEEFNLTEKAKDYSDRLSGGQMQRLSIALALVNDPDLVFLDEPTTGLDPQARLNLWDVIEGIRQRDKTVMLTTHYMEEAERLCDRVAVMDHGKIVALDTPAKLIQQYASGTTIECDVVTGIDVQVWQQIAGAEKVIVDRRVSIATTQPELVLRDLLDPSKPWSSKDKSVQGVRGLAVRQGTLEDVFINLTGKHLRT